LEAAISSFSSFEKAQILTSATPKPNPLVKHEECRIDGQNSKKTKLRNSQIWLDQKG
jgi:hypothetical protein